MRAGRSNFLPTASPNSRQLCPRWLRPSQLCNPFILGLIPPMPDIYMSRAGYDKLMAELKMLEQRKRDLSHEIGETREQGDLRENAGYHFAREKQSETLRRIAEIHDKISSAKII